MRSIGLLAAILFLAFAAESAEMRGIWVDAFGPGFKTESDVRQLVEDCRKYNFNAVFVQMRKRGDAYYLPKAPNPDVRAIDIDPEFDALAEIIQRCHTGNPRIEVHCWAVAYFVWAFDKAPPQKEHIFNTRPDLLTRDSIGQKLVGNGYYLDPGHPEVSKMLLAIAKDIVQRYDVEGFHWDYLRYPNRDSGFNDVALKRYQEDFKTSEKPQPDDQRFCEWRQKQIIDFLRSSTAALRAIKPSLVISASVFSNYKDSAEYRMADWVAWNKEGILDATVPMNFSPDNKFIFDPRADFALKNQWKARVWIGVGAYMNSFENTIRQLRYCRENEASGTILYSYRNFSTDTSHADQMRHTEAGLLGRAITIDNHDAMVIGGWKIGQFGKMYDDNYLFIGKGVGTNIVVFNARVTSSDDYDVYEWHVAGTNRSAAVPYTIKAAGHEQTVVVNQQIDGSNWNFLSRVRASDRVEVVISDGIPEAKAVVIADAVRIVPASGEPHISFTSQIQKIRDGFFRRIKDKYQDQWVTPDYRK